MLIERAQNTDYLSNTYLVSDGAEGDAVVIDAGGPPAPIFAAAERLSVTPSRVLLTHHHHDHVSALGELTARWPGIDVLISPIERELVAGVTATIDAGERLTAGGLQIRPLRTPGHTAGMLSFLVEEGGNAAVSPGGTDVDWPDSLQILTTGPDPAQRLLSTINATSAATAAAAHMAAVIAADYPAFWPETTRALMVHSAEWTEQMRDRFRAAGTSKTARAALVRRYGFGVPTLDRCLRSATNALTLIVQDTIHPFQAGKLREMHIHDLPWPTEVLADLGEIPVRLRVTLSYFIEPSPTRRGWRRRYRYASHQLRFELQQATETNDEFRKRLNRRALDEEEQRPSSSRAVEGWTLGSDARNHGSLHGDIWEGTAAELAARGRIAVYPVTGWWKELPTRDRSDLGARYALLVSIEAPVEDVDLWTPVAQQVGLPIAIQT